MKPLLSAVSPEAQWLLEALFSDARGKTPAWKVCSSFHLLRTLPPEDHPGFGVALLQWQRMSARFGALAPAIAAEAFRALPRGDEASGHVYAARVLELWVRHVPLPIEVAERFAALMRLDDAECAMVAEDLALGAYEGGKPSAETLDALAARPAPFLYEALAIAQTERFLQGKIDERSLGFALAPGLFEDDRRDPITPGFTMRLINGWSLPLPYSMRDPRLEGALTRLRKRASELPLSHRAAGSARTLIESCAKLQPSDLVSLAKPGRAARSAVRPASLPEPSELAPLLATLDEDEAVRVAIHFPVLSGTVELARGLPGLTAWRQAHRLGHPPGRAPLPHHPHWDALAPEEAFAPLPDEKRERLLQSLRTGAPLSRDFLQGLRAGGIAIDALVFQSPGGPGALSAEGELRNGVRSWPAPESLALVHPTELYDAERAAWQARILATGQVAPLNQLFRETHTAGGRELTRKRLDRMRGVTLSPLGLDLLSDRGWFPIYSPAEIAPELELGDVTARLIVERQGPSFALVGLDFFRGPQQLELAEVPVRAFSESWRDVDEALALGLETPSWLPSGARAELLRAIGPRLGVSDLRIESDHLAFRVDGEPERLTLHNARRAEGEHASLDDARKRASRVLPFEDDGGVAAVLVGRLLALTGRFEASSGREEQEGT